MTQTVIPHIPDKYPYDAFAAEIPLRFPLRTTLNHHSLWRWFLAAANRVFCNPESDRATLERLFLDITDRYGRMISKLCYCYAVSEEDFQDLRQDVLTNIWRGLPSFRKESERSTWIYRICLNTCVSTWRKTSKHQQTMLGEEYTKDTAYTPVDNEQVDILYRVISMLNSIDKGMLLMWLNERSYDEIAEVMGMNRNTVATRIRRAKEKIASLWPECE